MKVPKWFRRRIERQLRNFARDVRDTRQILGESVEIVRLMLLYAEAIVPVDYAWNGGHDRKEWREELQTKGIIK